MDRACFVAPGLSQFLIRRRSGAATVVVALLGVLGVVAPIGARSVEAAPGPHLVKSGDTLSVIARSHGLSTFDLAAANGLADPHMIRVGQVLNVPDGDPSNGRDTPTVLGADGIAPAPKAQPKTSGGRHRVVVGETLSELAKLYGITAGELAAFNGIANPHQIRVGQDLRLPPTSLDRYPRLPETLVGNPQRSSLVPVFERWANQYRVPTDLLMAIGYQESGWQAQIRSHKGAVGVGQLMPKTSAWVASHLLGDPSLDPQVPHDNIRMSARFLAWLLAVSPDESAAIAGYYQGASSVAANGPYDDTISYVANVQAARNLFVQD